MLNVLFAQSETFTAQQVQEDIAYLEKQFKRHHPNLYTYTSKTVIDSFFNAISSNIPEELTEQEIFCRITPIADLLMDGHTLFYPSQTTIDNHQANSNFFPFELHWDKNNLTISKNFSENSDLKDGFRIFKINGIAADELIDFLLKRMMRDGHNPNYPIWVLNNFFNTFYSYYFGCPNEFELEIVDGKGKIFTEKIKALSRIEIQKNRIKRYPDFKPMFDPDFGKGIYLETEKGSQKATLVIKDFHRPLLRKVYNQNFRKTIKGIFEDVKMLNINDLTIDFRDNQGGNIKDGRILLSYLLERDFEIMNQYNKVDKRYWNRPSKRLKRCKGPQEGTFKTHPNRYAGKLTIITNGGSFSNTAIVCSALKYYERASFIGVEPGGSQYIISANVKKLKLPNTKIKVEMPTLQFVIRGKYQIKF